MSCDRQAGTGASSNDGLMTVGELARRTGLSIKAIRQFEASGLIYSAGRSESNYRLFDDTALLCAAVLRTLRSLGLTVKEIERLADRFHALPDEPIGPYLASLLMSVEQRIDQRLAELGELRGRVAAYRVEHADALSGRSDPSVALIGRPGVDLRVAFTGGPKRENRARRTGRDDAA